MDNEELSTPGASNNEYSELRELQELENINVWGREQEALENEALRELQIFQTDDKEDGELSDNEANKSVESKPILDIDYYLKSQDDLNKKHQFKKTLPPKIPDKNKDVANIITEKLNVSKREINKRKRKFDEEAKLEKKFKKCDSDSDYIPSDYELSDYEYNANVKEVKGTVKRNRKDDDTGKKIIDDGNMKSYQQRLADYYKKIEAEASENQDSREEFTGISKQLKILTKIWENLYNYQRKGVEWLWKLHKRSTGGLLGDEMGLGKTVQVIAFLSALSNSNFVSNYCRYTGLGPTIIVCPTTVIHQWVQHFHEWAPEMRVAVLHKSGCFSGKYTALINEIFKNKGIIVTSYLAILKYKTALVDLDWHYIVLDEGHKIRNPTAKITVAVKEFRTPHKLILTGSPMQNNLQELWSLFDFVCPSMLGTLPVFMEHFVSPIIQGGYTNATPMQEATALEMATVLKDMITPFLLRRSKTDLKDDISLPEKTEQVLFCSLSDEQRELYKGFLKGSHVESILSKGSKNWFAENHGRAQVLVGITMLRKICNHPDVYLQELENTNYKDPEEGNGHYKRSGKMVVVSALLKIWKKQNHRVLLFTQGRAMFKIFEQFLQSQDYKYLKMDGNTNIKSRQSLINTFNEDSSYDVFLLTTRVGGLGVNLTGANRVIIYDPDWNPATDTQARERAWRIGQTKQVTVYRLISAGTIEEKMYQRQVWKQLLSNKILLDPRTQKFFTTSDLHDLFSLQEPSTQESETGNIFKNARVSVQEKLKEKKTRKRGKVDSASKEITFSEDKIEQMKNLAQAIARNMSKVEGQPEKKKYPHEIEEELEKKRRDAERRYMKTLTVQELIDYNRSKLLEKEDPNVNKMDDFDTEVSFSKALEVCEKTTSIYNKMKQDKLDMEAAQDKYEKITKAVVNEPRNKYKKGSKNKIDGETVDNLVKVETRKCKSDVTLLNNEQDDFVLGKLFSKKGIHSALQHDVIVDAKNNKPNKFSMHSEAQMKTEQALQALRRSRLKAWHW